MAEIFPPFDGTLEIDYVEIPAPNLEAAKAFYGQLFNWKIGHEFGGSYVSFQAGRLRGGFATYRTPTDRGILLVIRVASIDAVLAQIPVYGGSIVKPRTWYPWGEYRAEFKDPNGNLLAILAR